MTEHAQPVSQPAFDPEVSIARMENYGGDGRIDVDERIDVLEGILEGLDTMLDSTRE